MKKNTLLMLCIVIGFKSDCQMDTTHSISIKTTIDYSQLIQKSKDQKTTAWIMLGGGTLMTVGGIILWANKEEQNKREYNANSNCSGWFCLDLGYVYQFNGWLILSAVGTSTAILSSPVFHAARKNRKNASLLSTSLIMEKSSLLQGLTLSKINYPAFSIKLSL